jgi:hypothetical protein
MPASRRAWAPGAASAQGRANLSHPDASTWTAAEALGPIAWLTGRPIPLPSS